MAEVDWAGMLAAGDIDGFNEKRGERTRPDLFAADLAGKPLHSVDLSNANAEKSDFTGADLTEANLMRANLSGIDGTGMKLVDVMGLKARFNEAWMDQSDLTGADFSQSAFNSANVQGSKGQYVRFVQAKLKGVNAEDVQWPEADLSEAKLHQGVFRNADLRQVDLTAANGAEIDLSGARMDGAQANECRFPGGKLVGVRLAQARIQRANLSNADLTGADLSAADLTQANLSGANLSQATLRGAVLADANLEGAILEGADLTDADLSGIDPIALGLSEEVVATLSSWGVAWEPDAPWVFTGVSAARRESEVALVWINPEGEDSRSVRWAVLEGDKVEHGVIPVPADAVLDIQVAHDEEGFVAAVLRDRPEGTVLTAYPIQNRALGAARSAPLGYEPVVKPVVRTVEGRVHMLGLARKGPGFVVTDLSGEQPAVVHTQLVQTAQGFLRGQPVLACKGGVVMSVQGGRAARPRRTPEGFPGLRGLVAPLPEQDMLIAMWVEPRVGDRPGGMRLAEIGPRHAPTTEVVDLDAGIVAMDAHAEHDHVRFLWAVADEDGQGPTQLRSLVLPDGQVQVLDAPDDIFEIRMRPGVAALVRIGGEVVLIDPVTARVLARAGA